ncbi:MAG: hypothetical protein ACM359_06810 [Bacillota bacterium]
MRYVFGIVAVLSLLLCMAAMALWGRSYFVWDRGFVCGEVVGETQNVIDVSSSRGQLTLTLTQAEGFSLGSSPREGARIYQEELSRGPSERTWLGFRFGKEIAFLTYDHTARVSPKRTIWTAIVPDWFVVVLTAAMPVVWTLRGWQRVRRRAAGCCVSCGYDLRASKERCPECGRAIGRSTRGDC